MGIIRKNIGFLIWLFLPAYFLVLKNSIRNRHSHILPNGLVIYHSHPIHEDGSQKPFSHHKHTKTEIFFFQNFNIDFHDFSRGISCCIPVFVEKEDLPVLTEFLYPSASKTHPDLRAPPSRVI